MTHSVQSTEGQYVFGVIDAATGVAREDELAGVRIVRCGGVGALVSDVALSDWEPLRLLDPQVLAERVRRHHAVLDAAARRCTAVPMRLGIIVRGESEVVRWLRAWQETLLVALQALAGREEWGLKLRFEKVQAIDMAGDGTPETAEGTRYLMRKHRQRTLARQAAEEQARLADWVRDQLFPLADATAVLAAREGFAFNHALLVRTEALPAIFAKVDEANSRLGGRGAVELNGPWPAYTFALALVQQATPASALHG